MPVRVPLPCAADSTLHLLLNVHHALTPRQQEKQLFDKQGSTFHTLIGLVVEILSIWPKIFLACVLPLQSHWFP